MFDIVLVIACLYFAYNSFRLVMEVPFAEWTYQQYILLGMVVLLLVAAVIKGRQAWQKKKVKDAEEAEKKAEEAAAEAERKKQADAFDDLAYLDELDAEEDAALEGRSRWDEDENELAYLDELDAEEDAARGMLAESGGDTDETPSSETEDGMFESMKYLGEQDADA